MASYLIEGPNGQKFQVDGPAGASPEQLQELIAQVSAPPSLAERGLGALDFVNEASSGVVGRGLKGLGRIEAGVRGIEPEEAFLYKQGELAEKQPIPSPVPMLARAFGRRNPEFEQSVPGQVVRGLAEAPTYMAAGLPAGVGLGMAGGIESALSKADEKGADLSTGQSLALGAGGAAIGASEFLPFGRLIKQFGEPAVKRTINALKQAGFEGTQEALSEAAYNALAKGVYNKDQAILEGTGEAAGVGGIVGGVLGAALPGRSNAPEAPQEVSEEDVGRRYGLGGETASDGNVKPQGPKEELNKAILDIMEAKNLTPQQAKKDPDIRELSRVIKAYEIVETGEARIKDLEARANASEGVAKRTLFKTAEKEKQRLEGAKKRIAEVERPEDITPGDGVLPEIDEESISTLGTPSFLRSEITDPGKKPAKSALEEFDVDTYLQENPQSAQTAAENAPDDFAAERFNQLKADTEADMAAKSAPIEAGKRVAKEQKRAQKGFVNENVAVIPPIVADENYQPDPLKGKGLIMSQRDDGIREGSGEGVQDVINRTAGVTKGRPQNTAQTMQEALTEPSGRVAGEGQLEEDADRGGAYESEAEAAVAQDLLTNRAKYMKELNSSKTSPERKQQILDDYENLANSQTKILEAQIRDDLERKAMPAKARKAIGGETDTSRKAPMARAIEEDLAAKEAELGGIEQKLDADTQAVANDVATTKKSEILRKKLSTTKNKGERVKLIKEINKTVQAENRLADRTESQETKRKLLSPKGKGGASAPMMDSGVDTYSLFSEDVVNNLEKLGGWKDRKRVIHLRPSEFLALAENDFRASSMKTTTDLLESKTPFNEPVSLKVDRDGKVIGHEGRHRMRAIMNKYGDIPVPIELQSDNIRWANQKDPDGIDWVKDWPKEFIPQNKAKNSSYRLPFPSRNDPMETSAAMPNSSYQARNKAIDESLKKGDLVSILNILGSMPRYEAIIDRIRPLILSQSNRIAYSSDTNKLTDGTALKEKWDRTTRENKGVEPAGIFIPQDLNPFSTNGVVLIKRGANSPHVLMHELLHMAVFGRYNLGRRVDNADTELGKAAARVDEALADIKKRLKEDIELLGTAKVSQLSGLNPTLFDVLMDTTPDRMVSTFTPDGSTIYALTNGHELLSEALSNPFFQKYLLTIPSSKKGLRNMLTDLFKRVAQMLGMNSRTALSDVLDAFDVISSIRQADIKQMQKDAPMYSYGRAAPMISPAQEKAFGKNYKETTVAGKLGEFITAKAVADKFEAKDSPLLKKLGRAIREWSQAEQKYMGMFQDKLQDLTEAYNSIPIANQRKRKKFVDDYEEFYRALQFGTPTEVKNALAKMDPEARRAVKATSDALGLAQDETVKRGVEVNRDGKVVPFEPRKNYFPLIMKPEFKIAFLDPNSSGNKEIVDGVTKWMIDNGKAKNRQNAIELINSYSSNTRRLDDFFGNIERSRTDVMPPFIYDFTPNAVKIYRDSWASRMAQIEAFGQRIGKKKTLFQEVVEEPGILMEDRIAAEAAAADIYKETVAGEAVIPGEVSQTLDILNNIAVFNQLGSWGAAMNNFFMGWTLQTSNTGFAKTIKALGELSSDFDAVRKQARRLGLLREDDVINLGADNAIMGKNGFLQKSKAVTNTVAQFGLKYSGFNEAENQVRMGSFLVSKYMLQENLADISEGLNTARSELWAMKMKREGIDVKKLQEEQGKPDGEKPETEKYFRKMVNLVHGSYKIDQIPQWVNTPMGKFFFKYYKFIMQSTRVFYRDKVEPTFNMQNGLSPKARGRLFAEVMAYMLTAALGGLGFMELKEEIFGTIVDGSKLEIVMKNLQDENYRKAVANAWDSLVAGLIASGNIGLASQVLTGVEYVKAKAEGTYTSVRPKNPIDPPGLAAVSSLGNIYVQASAKGWDLSAKDWENFAVEANRFYRESVKRIPDQMASGFEDTSYRGKVQNADEDSRYTKSKMRDFLKETKRQIPATSGGGLEDLFKFADIKPADERSDLKYGVREALLLGESEKAYELMTDQLKKAGDQKQANSTLDSIRKTVEKYDPLYVNIPKEEREQLEQDFIDWAYVNLPQSDYERVIGIVTTYRTAAIKANLMSISKSKPKREKPQKLFDPDRFIRKSYDYRD